MRTLIPRDSTPNDYEQLITFLKTGQSVTLVGIPGIGKSPFLQNLQTTVDNTDPDTPFLFIYVNLDDLTNDDISTIYRLLIKRIYDTLLNEKSPPPAIKKLYEESKQLTEEFYLFETLKELIAVFTPTTGRQPVVVLDNFYDFYENTNPKLFNNFRALRDQFKPALHFIFTLAVAPHQITQISENGAMQDLLARQVLYIHPTPEKEMRHEIISYLGQKNLSISTKMFSAIYKLTGGHAGLTLDLIRMAINTPGITNRNLKKKAFENPGVTTRLQRILATGTDINQLKKHDIHIPLLEAYAKKKPKVNVQDELPPTPFVYNNSTDDILIHGVVNNELSPKEFTLLKYFIGHSERVCGKDEIAEAVWGHEANNGVSDEAIDKLVQRLRARIENNKSKPQHLMTIRGRGYKLVNS